MLKIKEYPPQRLENLPEFPFVVSFLDNRGYTQRLLIGDCIDYSGMACITGLESGISTLRPKYRILKDINEGCYKLIDAEIQIY